jgi:hypothetical protein
MPVFDEFVGERTLKPETDIDMDTAVGVGTVKPGREDIGDRWLKYASSGSLS